MSAPRGLITDGDTAENAEFKAAMAETVLCELLISHFRRTIALIDYLESSGAHKELRTLLPAAFALAGTPADLTLAMTNSQARSHAQHLVDELTLGVHSLDLGTREPAGDHQSNTPPLLRKSVAVVNEASTIERITTTTASLQGFEKILTSHPRLQPFINDHPATTQIA